MSLIQLNTKPSSRDLRIFSALWLLFFGALGAVAWRKGAERAAFMLWAVGASGGVAGLIAPGTMRYVYLAAIYLTFPIGFIGSHVILGAVYYLVLTPVGLIMWLLRYDPLTRRFEPQRKSYWNARAASKAARTYFRQH